MLKINSNIRLATALAGLIGVFCTVAAFAGPLDSLQPTRHGDFGHYTLALTWQPGFCAEGSCSPDQNRAIQIGIHGLWASRPQHLIDQDIQAPRWWSKGCDLYHHSEAAPELSDATHDRLEQLMPQLEPSLLTHEYDKHVQCFGFDTQQFFDAELALRDRVADSPFGGWLRAHSGQSIARTDLLDAFDRVFDTDKTKALQLRCSGKDDQRYLNQLWFTIPRQKLAAFPQDAGLMNAPIAQHNCPARFTIPAWDKAEAG